MASNADFRIGLTTQSRSKSPVLQYVMFPSIPSALPHWRIWTAYDHDLQHGTFFALFLDGTVRRVTINPDDTYNVVNLKGNSK